MRGVRTVGLCSPRPRRVGYHEAKAHEKHRNRELTDVWTRCDTPALDLHCAPRLWHNRALEKTLFLAHGAADFLIALHIPNRTKQQHRIFRKAITNRQRTQNKTQNTCYPLAGVAISWRIP